MRKLLLTTALVSLALVPAAKADMEVKLGGYMTFQAAAFDNDAANGSGRDFQTDSEIHLTAKGTTDAGLTYGAYIELQASTSDTANSDEANLFFSGNWGKLELGDQEGAGSALSIPGPYVGIGQVYGSMMDFIIADDRGYAASEGPGDTALEALDTGDATKITYYTPVFYGLQLGGSYAPERDSFADGEQVQFSDTTGNHHNAFEFGAQYNREFSGVGFKMGGSYQFAEAKDGATVEDINAWTLGAQLAYQGFAVGGGYTHDGDSGLAVSTADDEVSKWFASATYAEGPWGVGISYAQVDFDQAATPFGVAGVTGSGGDFTIWAAGATYKVAPGLTVGADVGFYDRDRVTGTDTDGYVAMTEVKAAF